MSAPVQNMKPGGWLRPGTIGSPPEIEEGHIWDAGGVTFLRVIKASGEGGGSMGINDREESTLGSLTTEFTVDPQNPNASPTPGQFWRYPLA